MNWNTATITDMETDLVGLEAEISRLRARQIVLINELDRAQAHHSDGSRSILEWVQSHLDIDPDTARRLVYVARHVSRFRYLSFHLADGTATFARTVAALRYAETGVSYHDVLDSFDRDLAGVARLTARRRRVTSHNEEHTFAERYFTMQPTLDESSYRMWGQVPGTMGRTLETAICRRSDELRDTTGDATGSQSQRHADALVSIAHDSLDAGHTNTAANSTPHVTVFVDATTDDDPATTGAEIAYGPRVGPHTLESMLCSGRIQIVGMDDGVPVITSQATRAIPPAVRHAVLHRDGGCTIDGCRSRYRLEPHHVTPRSRGGDHSTENLTTLCWYHHHVAIHGNGYQIDPESPPQRRRLVRRLRHTSTDPP